MKLIYSLLFVFIFVFALSSVSASSSFKDMPDLCLQKNITGANSYKVWLNDYFDIDLLETIYIMYKDPINARQVRLPANYLSLNLECFEVSYGFANRTAFTGQEDLLKFTTYSDDCSSLIKVHFTSDNELDQTFNLTVSDHCSTYTAPDNNPVYINTSFTLGGTPITSLVHSYFPLDYDVIDAVSKSSGYVEEGYPLRFLKGKFGNALNISSYASYFNTAQILDTLSTTNSSVSFWLNTTSFAQLGVLGDFITCSDQFTSAVGSGTSGYGNYIVDNPRTHDFYVGNFDSGFHFLVVTLTNSNYNVYVDNSYVGSFAKSITGNFLPCSIGNSYPFSSPNSTFIIDDLVFWKKALNSSDISSLYNSGSGISMAMLTPNMPSVSSGIPDLYLNISSSAIINLSAYFNNWKVIYTRSPDPINSYVYNLYPGYSTLNADYYEIYNYASYLNISSYARPYNFEVSVYICGTTTFQDCILDTFNVYIQGNISEVIQVNPFEAYYNINPHTNKSFSGNHYFQYYDTIIFSFPDTNMSGSVIPSIVNYTSILNSSSYMVYLPCNITKSLYSYVYSGDINVSVTCGSGQSYFDVSGGGNYSNRVYFTATNSFSTISDFTNFVSTSFGSGYGNVASSSQGITDNLYSFNKLLPSGVSTKFKHRLVFLVLFAVVISVFALLFRNPVIALHLSIILVTFLLFLFANVGYITLLFPILLLFGYVLFLLMKYFGGLM